MAASDIDRLIEMGLNRYGAGDLDGALLLWEEALAIDPDNAQANSYVDYVRMNYELLSSPSDPEVASEHDGSFGLDDEPEYQIEIVPGELEAVAPERVSGGDGVDAGWFMEEETHDASAAMTAGSAPAGLELDLELPPPAIASEQSFEDATREYHGQGAMSPGEHASDFAHADPAAEFQSEGTPVGFAMQETEVRKRDLGFVQPAATPAPAADKPPPIAIGTAATVDILAVGDQTAKLETSSRDILAVGDQTAKLEPSSRDILSVGDQTAKLEPSSRDIHSVNPFASVELGSDAEDDLISSLPTPRPAADRLETTRDVPLVAKTSTRDLPQPTRAPARRESDALSQAEVMLTHAPTQDFGPQRLNVDVTAPTREIGTRPGTSGLKPHANPDDDDVPTRQSDVRAIREAAARGNGGGSPAMEGTRHDIVLPFDPIDARSAQILDEVDEGAPPNESREDTTRRRITSLLQRAVEYNAASELDKAVTAVDLALSEDPNSALGQKLVTRNRDTIMQVFQAFLGDLERMPQLARPLHELASAPISPRAAFLLSRIDGTLTIDELLDVSGMPRLEAYRHLCQLFLRGILR